MNNDTIIAVGDWVEVGVNGVTAGTVIDKRGAVLLLNNGKRRHTRDVVALIRRKVVRVEPHRILFEHGITVPRVCWLAHRRVVVAMEDVWKSNFVRYNEFGG